MPALLEINKISKSFPGVQALDRISMEIELGEIHALMGENGAGKSTLVKIITGVLNADAGEILFNGKSITQFSPAEVHNLGISVIFQDINLIPELSVSENIYLARLPIKGKLFINKEKLKRDTEAIIKDLGLEFSMNDKVGDLSSLDQKMVAIARSLSFQPKLIVMDEPTAALSRNEIRILFEKIRYLKSKGVSILYISHFLEEVFEIADRITVIRDGKKIGTKTISEISADEIVYMMVGHKVSIMQRKASQAQENDKVLIANNLSLNPFIYDVSFELLKGEILGITGSAGSGKTALARMLFGTDHPDSGEIIISGKVKNWRFPSDAINSRIGYVPQNRHTEGVLLGDSIVKNISLPSLSKLSKVGFINKKAERDLSQYYYDQLSIKARSLQMLVENLSGGNQQKVSIAKWLALNPEILILDEPTQGIDVGTKQELYSLIQELAEKGVGIIFISSEPTELAQLCDRVIILRRGKIASYLVGKTINREHIIKEITGAKEVNNINGKSKNKIAEK